MYKKISELIGNTKTDKTDCILKIKDESGNTLTNSLYIPFDEANTDYQEYLDWKDAGNTPDAAD